MARPLRKNRSTITDGTLTLRLTHEDRDVLDCLVAHQAKSADDQGFAIEPTVASFLRGLIRREAQRMGIEAGRGKDGQAICTQEKKGV